MASHCGKEGSGMCGCCHEAGFKKKDAEIVARDPVCGKKIDCEDKNAIKLPHGDVLYYFCSTMCMTDFISDPEKYKSKKRGFFGLFQRR